MKSSLVVLCLTTIIALWSLSECRVDSKDMIQQPLLFGRRGVNPNLNSLFFGK
ncbi:hypothetical protein BgiMline_026484, partial [Biomphalaria glabrata]